MTTDAFASFETKLQQFADGLTDDEIAIVEGRG